MQQKYTPGTRHCQGDESSESGSEHLDLRPLRPAELSGGKLFPSGRKPMLPGAEGKQRLDCPGDLALACHAGSEPGIIEVPAAGIPDPVNDLPGPLR